MIISTKVRLITTICSLTLRRQSSSCSETRTMAEQRLDLSFPPCLHLVSAFLAMEPIDYLISFARACGGGSVTEEVQKFIWEHCLSKDDGFYGPYLKKFMKKLLSEVEMNSGDVLDVLYELYAQYMASIRDGNLVKGNSRICKRISFLFPNELFQRTSCPESRQLVVSLQCSLNMLEGDTGCCIWPSSLFLSEFVLSFPELFFNKSCCEVGSGVGLLGICLAHVKASQVILTDGDLSTLSNMKLNLELNQLTVENDMLERTGSLNKGTSNGHEPRVKCIHLPWESTSESELQDIMPEIILGADVIYDPVCLPHLVRLLEIFLDRRNPNFSEETKQLPHGFSPEVNLNFSNVDGKAAKNNSHGSDPPTNRRTVDSSSVHGLKGSPIAYIACVIRNIDTFNYFLTLVEQANLYITDLTNTLKPHNLLPYLQSYDRNAVKLLAITCR